mgnify:CR=1 FL=1
MQVKVGTDIIEVNRIEQAIKKHGDKFLTKIFTPDEIKYCNKNADTKYQHFAVRFAAKEAAFKAISDILNNVLVWTDIEVINNSNGKPVIKLYNVDKEKLELINSIDISLSHVKDTAVATVVAIIN